MAVMASEKGPDFVVQRSLGLERFIRDLVKM